ncbi:hypothetical protein [uncultured Amnibacterium sp.]|uniref:hypothetical protein n=1 Tax=uncultured Amnibacterium sp. TaxID=1631851 RepID=UPI0035C9C7C6
MTSTPPSRCRWCGEARLVAVLLPGHGDPEATVCLACGRPQPVEQEHRAEG